FREKAKKHLGGLVRRVNLFGAATAVGRAALIAHGADLPPEVNALAATQLLKPEPAEDDEEEGPNPLHSREASQRSAQSRRRMVILPRDERIHVRLSLRAAWLVGIA